MMEQGKECTCITQEGEWYPVDINDVVVHIKDVDVRGVVMSIDKNLPHPTTCRVLWDDCRVEDVVWTNKLTKITH